MAEDIMQEADLPIMVHRWPFYGASIVLSLLAGFSCFRATSNDDSLSLLSPIGLVLCAAVYFRHGYKRRRCSFRWSSDLIEFTPPAAHGSWVSVETVQEDGVSFCFIGPFHKHHVFVEKEAVPEGILRQIGRN